MKSTYFEGYIQRSHSDSQFTYLKLYETINNVPEKDTNYRLQFLDSLKDFDLLLITKDPLETKEVKKITSSDFL